MIDLSQVPTGALEAELISRRHSEERRRQAAPPRIIRVVCPACEGRRVFEIYENGTLILKVPCDKCDERGTIVALSTD